MSGSITISGRQRNLLYKPTLDFLSVADDAYTVAIRGRYEEADRLGAADLRGADVRAG